MGNPPNILKEPEPEEPTPSDGDDAQLAARVERYTKISAHASTNEALVQFKELYARTCADFYQEPVPSVEGVINLLITGDMPLNTLSLGGKGKAEKLVDSQLFPLFEVLGHGFPNCPFTTIDLSWNMIRNSGAKAIAVYLTQTRTLTALDLSGNKCEQLGIEKLAQALYGQTTLTSLKLSCNPVGDVGMGKLADALLGNNKLTEVDLGSTDLGTVTLMKLASAIRADAQVQKLNINNPLLYSLEEETTIAISKAIGANTTLKELYMQRHRMQDYGASWLAQYLVMNSSLELVDLRCNQLTATGVATLVTALSKRSVGCSIRLDGNKLKGREHDEIIDAIQEADDQNTPVKVTFKSDYEFQLLTAEKRADT
jgi:Ran GTPase-activating protein (RanGAP) involved in mRNA processing and transport